MDEGDPYYYRSREKRAALSGNDMKIEFYRHNIESEDIEKVAEVLRSVFLTTGPVTTELEGIFSKYVGLRFTIGLSSCTAALHLALLALGIGPGHEVITTPMTFIATATSILHTGARPVFVDVEGSTALMDASRVEAAITPRTRAIMPVHLYGSMVDMRAIRDIADPYHLKIVEDCAHCIEGERDGIRPGQWSDAACYSFYATKNLTCGEGGALSTNDPHVAEKVRILRLHGMSKDAASRYTDRYQHWDMILEGWKYNLDDIHSALLIGQIPRLDGYWQRRREICERYDRAFGDHPGIEIPRRRGRSAMHLYTIWVDPEKRDFILHEIQGNGINVAVNYRAIHNLTYFKEAFAFKPTDFPVADRIGRRTITLPLYPRLAEEEVEFVIETVRRVIS